MNYSKNLRKKAIARRIVTSWMIVALVFWLFGIGVGYAVKPQIKTYPGQLTICVASTQSTPYGGIYNDLQDILNTSHKFK